MYLKIILILYLINNVQLCVKEEKCSYIEAPIVLVTSTGKLNNLIDTINTIEYYNAANKIITVNIKIIDVIYTDKSYNNINIFNNTRDYLHIFYVDQYVAHDNSIHTNFIRRSDETLNDYITFNNDTYIEKRKYVPYEMLDYNKYYIHFNRTTNIIKIYDKKTYVRESVIMFGNNDINKIITYINIAISKQTKNLSNIGKNIYTEKFKLYNNNQRNELFINNSNNGQLLDEYVIYEHNFKIIACNTNQNNKKHCCSELNDFTGSNEYSLIVNSNNTFIIVPIITYNIIKTEKFILPVKNIHFNIEYSCDKKICYNMYDIIKKSINILNKMIYNVNFTCSKSENKHNTNLEINFVSNINEKNKLKNTVTAGQTFGDVYSNNKIIMYIVNKYPDKIIEIIILHELISHVLRINHQPGQKYTELTSAVVTGSLISKTYFIFYEISPLFERNNIETSNIETNNCKNILNTTTTSINKCENYFEFNMIKNHKKQKIEDLNKEMYNNLENKVKIYSSLYDTLNNDFTDALIVDKNNLEYIEYNNEYQCGFINSRCISIAKIKYNNKIYYINLGYYNSILIITKDNYVICCIDGILCNSLSNNLTNINQYYRSYYFNNY